MPAPQSEPRAIWPAHKETLLQLAWNPWIPLPPVSAVCVAETSALSADSPEIKSLLESLTDPSACRRIELNRLGAGEEVFRPAVAEGGFTIYLALTGRGRLQANLGAEGATNRFSRNVPLEPRAPILFDLGAPHRLANDGREALTYLKVTGPVRISEEDLLGRARESNRLPSHQHAVRAVVTKKSMLGETVSPTSALFLDWLSAGAVRVFPDYVAVGVVPEELEDALLAQECANLTRASLFPVKYESVPPSLAEDWIRQQARAGKEFVLLLSEGTFLTDGLNFSLDVMRAFSRLEREKLPGFGHRQVDGGPGRFLLLSLKHWEEGEPGPLPASLAARIDYARPGRGRGADYYRVKAKMDERLAELGAVYYVFNTERLGVRDFGLRPNLIITPCAGLKPLVIYRQLVAAGEPFRFVFLENNKRALAFYRALLGCSDYESVLECQRDSLRELKLFAGGDLSHVKTKMDTVLAEGFGSDQNEFMRCLKEVGRAALLRECDYHTDHEQILSLLEPDTRLFFWHSNAWETHYALYKFSPADLRRNYRDLVRAVSRRIGQPAWIHKNAFETVWGPHFSSPTAVFTAGGAKTEKPRVTGYEAVPL